MRFESSACEGSKRIFTSMKLVIFATVLAFLILTVCGCGSAVETSPPPPASSSKVIEPPESAKSNATIQFLLNRIKADPDDFVAYNKLASEYLKEMRATGDVSYLELALSAAKASLDILPAEQNKGGLAALARAEFSAHQFVNSRDHALRLTQIDPGKAYVYQLLSDAHYELGQYDVADEALRKMSELIGDQGNERAAVEQRLAKMAAIHGDVARARAHMTKALQLSENISTPSAETIAWTRWQLGEIAFSQGDLGEAEKQFNAALKTLPGYFAATEALNHLRAARGDIKGAIEGYEKATAGSAPDPAVIVMLGDLYKLSGRDADAAAKFAQFDEFAHAAKGNIYGREILMFYANHDIKTAEACEAAARDYETRKDIFGADVVAWACFKAGQMDRARSAMNDALRFGTKDAQLFYHAGMIENALGNKEEARRLLSLSLKTNPAFDMLQADVLRKALAAIE
jgi:tetratricopeptide (TPR) repeat protein